MGRKSTAAFSLFEMLVAFAIFSAMMVFLLTGLSSVTTAWIESERRVETYQEARAPLELFSREIAAAVVDTRMQFVVMPGHILAGAGVTDIVPSSPAVLWMAPLGKDGELRCVGYYLVSNAEKGIHRLKRIFVKPDNASGYFPRLVNVENARDLSMRTDPTSADWFLDNWDERAFDESDITNRDVIVSSVANGVIGFWVQCYDLLGNPIPRLSRARNHPRSELIYNSAAFMQMATTEPFDHDRSTVFLDGKDRAMKANRVPAAVEIVIVTVDEITISRGVEIPQVTEVFSGDTLDLDSTVEEFMIGLETAGIRGAKVFSTKVKLVNGT